MEQRIEHERLVGAVEGAQPQVHDTRHEPLARVGGHYGGAGGDRRQKVLGEPCGPVGHVQLTGRGGSRKELAAAESRYTVQSGWRWMIDAGHAGVTGPSMARRNASALR